MAVKWLGSRDAREEPNADIERVDYGRHGLHNRGGT